MRRPDLYLPRTRLTAPGRIAPIPPDCGRIRTTMPKPSQASTQRPAPRLYLVTPVVEDAVAFAGELAQAIEAADIAAVLLRLKDADERTLINQVKALMPVAQRADVALVLDGRPE